MARWCNWSRGAIKRWRATLRSRGCSGSRRSPRSRWAMWTPRWEAGGAPPTLVALHSKHGKILVKGWQEATDFTAEDVIQRLEPFCGGFLCTYVDKEGMMQGTDLDWFRRLRAARQHEITAAGGITTMEEIRALQTMNVHAALGMAIYTGRLDLGELAGLGV